MPSATEILATLNRVKSRRSALLAERETLADGSREARQNCKAQLLTSADEYNALADRCDNAGQTDRAESLRKEARECLRLADLP